MKGEILWITFFQILKFSQKKTNKPSGGKQMAEFSFEIEEKLLVLSENDKGWTKELNRVSFNGAPAKYDIRTWSPDHTKMGKGITLSNEEFQVLVDAFKN